MKIRALHVTFFFKERTFHFVKIARLVTKMIRSVALNRKN